MNSNQSADGAKFDVGLAALLHSMDPVVNKHDRAIVCIPACKENGINMGPEIIATLKKRAFPA